MKSLILSLLIIISIKTYGQNITSLNVNDLQNCQAKFIGDESALKRFFAMNIRYPMELDYGTMIGIIVIDQKNEAYKALTINSPGKNFDKEFNRVVQLSKGHWEKNDSINILYCTLTFDFRFVENEYFIDYDNQPKFIEGNIVLKNYADKKLKSDDKLIKSLNDSYSQEDYKSVLKISTELIKRNPFYSTFYVMRIKALSELGKDTTEDYWFLTEFLNKKEYKNIVNK